MATVTLVVVEERLDKSHPELQERGPVRDSEPVRPATDARRSAAPGGVRVRK